MQKFKSEVLKPNEIKQIRLSYHLSLREFGALIGISPSYLQGMEAGRFQPTARMDSLLRLSEHNRYQLLRIAILHKEYIITNLGRRQYNLIIKAITTLKR